jgi:hypothetical protein
MAISLRHPRRPGRGPGVPKNNAPVFTERGGRGVPRVAGCESPSATALTPPTASEWEDHGILWWFN